MFIGQILAFLKRPQSVVKSASLDAFFKKQPGSGSTNLPKKGLAPAL